MNITQLRTLVIQPVLKELGIYSQSAENLLVGTCIAESNGGQYIKQISGPALGIYQCEPATLIDIIENYLHFNKGLFAKLNKFYNPFRNIEQNLISNLEYQTAICRIHYRRIKEKLPHANDVKGLAEYWKKYYNTEKGKGSVTVFIEKYKIYGVN